MLRGLWGGGGVVRLFLCLFFKQINGNNFECHSLCGICVLVYTEQNMGLLVMADLCVCVCVHARARACVCVCVCVCVTETTVCKHILLKIPEMFFLLCCES